jgi:hypothetical protein
MKCFRRKSKCRERVEGGKEKAMAVSNNGNGIGIGSTEMDAKKKNACNCKCKCRLDEKDGHSSSKTLPITDSNGKSQSSW